ncbi:DUF305 domain-containing protein [Mycobacterium sp. DBP42]|jgi:uncharacterized protein (DUF305 family)|uniref:DUF305 domain-containing protein n=1 Tax=Mycobacterium sp. DBP42 TaxID=2545267 RepID=UPI00110CA720|nr:DUF305 domain-containing protein [Mycobacterium sp. DBP42]TMS52464.1 DUF305 domain-containing protein [Mycobacterium sp. DBP42]
MLSSSRRGSVVPRIGGALAALVLAFSLPSCSQGHAPQDAGAATDEPIVTGEPDGFNAQDFTFAHNMMTHAQQGIDMSTLVPERSTNAGVVAFASASATTLQSEMAVLRALWVQWKENPDIKTGDAGSDATMKGLVSEAAIAELTSSSGTEFDTLWLRSMISHNQGAIEMAHGEIAEGKNLDAVSMANQIVKVRQTEIDSMQRMLTS